MPPFRFHTSPEEGDYFIRADKQAAAYYLANTLHFKKWPSFYKELLICYSPYNYLVRYFQMQFCVLNRIPFPYYLWFMSLNYNCVNMKLQFKRKLEKLYDYVLRHATDNPTMCRSYSITQDSIANYNGDLIFYHGSQHQRSFPTNFPEPCDNFKAGKHLDELQVSSALGSPPFRSGF